MRKNIAILATVATMIFSGCGDDRSHPDGMDGGVKFVNVAPTAIIDINSTGHNFLKTEGGFEVYRYEDANTPFIFDASASHDGDENNQSIVSYDWNITSTFTRENCLDINNTGSIVYLKVCDEALNDGDINVSLTIKDDEDTTASALRRLKLN